MFMVVTIVDKEPEKKTKSKGNKNVKFITGEQR